MTGCAALVLAGGSGSRYGGDIPKQYQMLDDRMVLRHAVDAFLAHPSVDEVRVVLRPEDRPSSAFPRFDVPFKEGNLKCIACEFDLSRWSWWPA